MSAVVVAQPMEMARDGMSLLDEHNEIFVKQTKKGCMQELLGCEATNEFKIYPNKDAAGGVEMMYSLEESTFCQRFCCANMRGFTQTVWAGSKDGRGPTVMMMEKDLTCNASPCTCCCIPNITYKTADGSMLGSAELPCYWCLPKISLKNAAGAEEYILQQPSCMGGLCVNCMAEGCCNCKIPIYIYPAGSDGSSGKEVGKIIKLWRGLGTEVFTDAASFQVEMPKGIGNDAKARLLGTTMFINMMFFEKQE